MEKNGAITGDTPQPEAHDTKSKDPHTKEAADTIENSTTSRLADAATECRRAKPKAQ